MLVVNGESHCVEHVNPRYRRLDEDGFSDERVTAGHVSDNAAGRTSLVIPERGVGDFDKWNDRVEARQELEVGLGSVDLLVTQNKKKISFQKAPDGIVRRAGCAAWMPHALE